MTDRPNPSPGFNPKLPNDAMTDTQDLLARLDGLASNSTYAGGLSKEAAAQIRELEDDLANCNVLYRRRNDRIRELEGAQMPNQARQQYLAEIERVLVDNDKMQTIVDALEDEYKYDTEETAIALRKALREYKDG